MANLPFKKRKARAPVVTDTSDEAVLSLFNRRNDEDLRAEYEKRAAEAKLRELKEKQDEDGKRKAEEDGDVVLEGSERGTPKRKESHEEGDVVIDLEEQTLPSPSPTSPDRPSGNHSLRSTPWKPEPTVLTLSSSPPRETIPEGPTTSAPIEVPSETDPELRAYIAKAMLARKTQGQSEPPADTISVMVTSKVPDIHGTSVFQVNLTTPLEDVRGAWLRSAVGVEGEDIILTWRGNELYRATTLESLGIWLDNGVLTDSRQGQTKSEGFSTDGRKVLIDVWTKASLAADREEKARRTRVLAGEEEGDIDRAPPVTEEPVRAKVPKVRLTIQAADGRTTNLRGTNDTLIKSLLEYWLLKFPEDTGKTLAISFDGESLQPSDSFEDVGIEDHDKVEINIK